MDLHYNTGSDISEQHQTGTDQWLDLWTTTDTGLDYTSLEQASLAGQQCIACYCQTAPACRL